ncbi:hypothetical protein SAY86_002789 [Trapa natans]|uniref:Strictosidine synthase conserved region domain-containing protein n=1 Tax=Trapa natans TaxID=22666 RepID=A0AAN7LRK6_TRANT|nr:hypothetical protein SAY86_002789 [Trapa natans]
MKSLLHCRPLLGFLFVFIFFFFWAFPEATTSYELVSESLIKRSKQIRLPDAIGPESMAFDCRGRGPYVGVSDGRILKWRGHLRRWGEYTNRTLCDGTKDPKVEKLCGRPLGLKFDNRTCALYIADAYYGLLRARRSGGPAERVAPGYGGAPFKLTNGLDINTDTGEVYFTDSSKFFQRRGIVLAIMQGDASGRVMKYDPRTGNVSEVLTGLSFPNGIALSKDNSFLVVAEMGLAQLTRIWIKGRWAGTKAIFGKLARYPDNLKRTQNGEFWVALASGRGQLLREVRINSAKDDDDIPWFTKDPVAIKYDPNGSVVQILDGQYGKMLEAVSEVAEFHQALWIGSVVMPYMVKCRL